MAYAFYLPENNPTNLTGLVGGDISLASPLSGYLGELFAHVDAPPSGHTSGFMQWRKVYVRNEYTVESTETRIWLESAEHSGQVHFAVETGLGSTSASPTGSPTGISGWNNPEDYNSAWTLGTIAVNSYSGIWVRQTLSGIIESDPYATFRLRVGGIVVE